MTNEATTEEGSVRPRTILVPLAETRTARMTVDYAVDRSNGGTIHLVAGLRGEPALSDAKELGPVKAMLDRAAAWVREDSGDVKVETTVLSQDQYMFAPSDYAAAYDEFAVDHDVDEVVLDPEYWADTTGPMVAAFRNGLERRGLTVVETPAPRPARHVPIAGRRQWSKIGTVFAVSFGFYLLLGDPFYWFDLVTGVAVAAIVAVTLANVTFGQAPRYPASIARTVRFGLYVPYLLWEIVKANVIIAIVILRPSMPVDPELVRVRTRVGGGLPLLALANSITLTPGTLVVRADDHDLIVHTLIPAARADLAGGRLERAVRFVFSGRSGMRVASPAERGEIETITEEDAHE